MYGRPKDKGSYTDNAVLVYEGSEYGAGVLPERAVAIGKEGCLEGTYSPVLALLGLLPVRSENMSFPEEMSFQDFHPF